MSDKIRLSRLMLAAPASGSGKTTVTCALLRLFQRRGLSPCAFKCGPDYIDPMFHQSVVNVPSRNLDLFFSTSEQVRDSLARGSTGHGVAVMEGVMGYYDGVGGGTQASSWHLARETGTPVVLVVTPKGGVLSLAAVIQGVARFRAPGMLRGILLNCCGEERFLRLAPVLERETGLPVLGCLPELPDCAISSRHLGLVTAQEVRDLQAKVDRLAKELERHTDVEGLLTIAQRAPALECPDRGAKDTDAAPPVKIAVARDRAFCFYYEENFEALRRNGADLLEFSPMSDQELPPGTAGLYLGGGYPELYARQLSENRALREAIHSSITNGMPVLAECGGFLYLQQTLEDDKGISFPMTGFLPGKSANAGSLRRFGYLTLTAKEDTPYLYRGESIRAHEFHYWDSGARGDVCRGEKPSGGRSWDCVVMQKKCFAGFPHLYFPSNPAFARRFVAECRRFGGNTT